MNRMNRGAWVGLMTAGLFALSLAGEAFGGQETVSSNDPPPDMMTEGPTNASEQKPSGLNDSQLVALTDEELDQIAASGVLPDGFLFISVFGDVLVNNKPIKIPEGFSLDFSNSATVHIGEDPF